MRLWLWTAASNGPIVNPPNDTYVLRATVGWYWQNRTNELGEKRVSAPLCPPLIPHGLTREQTLSSALRNRLSHGTSFPPLNSNDVLKYWGQIKRSYQSRCRNICNTGHSGDVLKYEIHFTGLGLHSVAFNRVWWILLLFPVSDSVDECVSGLPLHDFWQKPDAPTARRMSQTLAASHRSSGMWPWVATGRPPPFGSLRKGGVTLCVCAAAAETVRFEEMVTSHDFKWE
jgi:hypothetical protein